MRLPLYLALGVVVSACAGNSADLPLVLRGTAPEVATDSVQIEKFPTGADIDALAARYRVFAGDFPDGVRTLSADANWWLIVPPIQNSGGYRLVTSLSEAVANACLAPPEGPATMALTSSAFLVALPGSVKTVNWDGPCSG